MNIEQFKRAAEKLAVAWNEFGVSIREAANAIEGMLDALFSNPELYPDAHGTPPKKYGMSQRKRPYNSICHYHYIPRVPRNLPYMRRAY